MAEFNAKSFACPIAQMAERWTPDGENPGLIRFFGARYMKFLTETVRLVRAATAS